MPSSLFRPLRKTQNKKEKCTYRRLRSRRSQFKAIRAKSSQDLISTNSQMRWHTSVILATWETEMGRIAVPG
jgi:hypothetical protein